LEFLTWMSICQSFLLCVAEFLSQKFWMSVIVTIKLRLHKLLRIVSKITDETPWAQLYQLFLLSECMYLFFFNSFNGFWNSYWLSSNSTLSFYIFRFTKYLTVDEAAPYVNRATWLHISLNTRYLTCFKFSDSSSI
jgi:hypothetical protein